MSNFLFYRFKFLTLILIAILTNSLSAQNNDKLPQEALVKQLIKSGEIDDSLLNWKNHLFSYYDRLIYSDKLKGSSCSVYEFGANSAHTKKFILLIMKNDTEILLAQSDSEYSNIIAFFAQLDVNEMIPVKVFQEIRNIYEYNKNTSWIPK